MTFFFESLIERIVFSRLGQLKFLNSPNKRLKTPLIAIPLNEYVLKKKYYQKFSNDSLFIISDPSLLNTELLNKNSDSFLFIYSGMFKTFVEILENKRNLFENGNILPVIPFNNPNFAINKTFAFREVENHIKQLKKFIKEYPKINFGITIRLFEIEELLDEYIDLITYNENIVLLNFSDIFDNLGQYRFVLKVLFNTKLRLDRNLAIMASGSVLPKHYAFLAYIGIDILNGSYSMLKGAEFLYDTIEHLLPFNKIRYLPCSCDACFKLQNLTDEKNSIEKAFLIVIHNLYTGYESMNKIRQYLSTEDFRSYVEKCCQDDMNLISALKIIDKEFFSELRNEIPITQDVKVVKVLGPSSYERPDFNCFREGIIERFTPEIHTKLIIVLPCSAKKPYSESKSHRFFLGVLRKIPEFNFIQEIILTSPLGAIPRQLERIYPANCYDISVTGYWDEEELKIASQMILKLIKKYNTNIPVICHLDGQYLEIISRVKRLVDNPIIFTNITGGTTSRDSLRSLETTITKVIEESNLNIENELKNFDYWIRSLLKIIDFQFGLGAGEKICKNGIKTRNNRANTQMELIDVSTKEKLGVLKHKTGQILLTLKGAEKLMPDIPNKIVFNGERITGTTLFRPGIIEFANNISPETNIIVLNKSKENIIGVGISLVSVNHLINSKSGRIAKIYEKTK